MHDWDFIKEFLNNSRLNFNNIITAKLFFKVRKIKK